MKKWICCALLLLGCGRTFTTIEQTAPPDETDAASGGFGGEYSELGGASPASSGGRDSIAAGGDGPASGGALVASGGADAAGGAGGSPIVEECEPQPLSPLKVEPGKCSVTSSVLYCVQGGPSELIVNGELRASDDFDAPGPVEWRLPEGLTEIVWLTCYPPGEGCVWDEPSKNWEGCL
jgi:hypothetical protein